MKRKYVFFLLVFEALIILGVWGYQSWKAEHTEHIKSYVRYIQSAVQFYTYDALLNKREKTFPASLNDLVAENILDSSDLHKINEFVKNLTYIPPKRDSPANFIILKGEVEDMQMTCPFFGNVAYIHAEQGAAANP